MLKKLCVACSLVLVMVGCSSEKGSVVAPAASITPPVVVSVPTPAPAAPWFTVSGSPTGGCLPAGPVYQWTVAIAGAPSDIVIDPIVYDDGRLGCDYTINHPKPIAATGPLTYAKGASGSTTFTLDTSRLTTCGRWQADLWFDEQKQAFVTVLIDSGIECVPIYPPVPIVSPIVSAGSCIGGNIFWHVNSSATLDVGTTFVGNILALTSASLNSGASLHGRVLVQTGAVTLTSGNVVSADCTPTTYIDSVLSPYAILTGSTVTCTAASSVSGDIGVSPGSAIVGFPAPCSDTGTLRVPPASNSAQVSNTAAFTAIGGLGCSSTIGPDLTGLTLTPNTYCVTAGVTNLSGTLTLDTLGDPSAQFVFKLSSTLITSPGSTVVVH